MYDRAITRVFHGSLLVVLTLMPFYVLLLLLLLLLLSTSAEDADEPPLHARSKNGQVTIDCSMQYSLPLTSIQTIYTSYSLAYHDKLLKVRTD